MKTGDTHCTQHECSPLACEYCDYKSNRAYNIVRHKALKHGNTSLKATEPMLPQKKCHACKFCKATFNHSSSKCRHMKVCSAKPEHAGGTTNITVNNTNTVNSNNNTVNNTTSNTTNNTINVIVFDPNEMQLLNDHIDVAELRKIMLVNGHDHRDVMRKFGRAILRRPENRCVKKINLRQAHSQVHVGNNKWESRLDADIYPKLTSSIADNLTELITSKRNAKEYRIFRTMFRTYFPYAEYIAGDGYCNTNDDEYNQRILRDFKKLARDLKLVVVDESAAGDADDEGGDDEVDDGEEGGDEM